MLGHARGRRGGRRPVRPRLRRPRAPGPPTTARSGGPSSGWPRSTTVRTLYRLGQSAGLPWGVIRSPEEVARRPPPRGPRATSSTLEHPELDRSVTYPGAPFLAHGSPWVMRPPATRCLGEHTTEVRRRVVARTARRAPGAAAPVWSGSARPDTPSGAGSPTRSEYQLAIEAITRRGGRRRTVDRRRRRSGLVRRRPQRRHLRRRRPGAARTALRHAVVAPRRAAGPARRWPTPPWPWRRGAGRGGRRLPVAVPGPVPPLRAGPGRGGPARRGPAAACPAPAPGPQPARGPRRLHHALRDVRPPHRLRHGPAAPHAPVRDDGRADGSGGRDDAGPRGPQPRGR